MPIRILAVLLSVFISFQNYAQYNNDSLIKALSFSKSDTSYISTAFFLMRSKSYFNTEVLEKVNSKVHEKEKNVKDNLSKAKIYSIYGGFLFKSGRADSGLAWLSKSATLFKDLNMPVYELNIKITMASFYLETSNFSEAEKAYTEIISLGAAAKDSSAIGIGYHGLGSINEAKGNLSEAMSTYKKALLCYRAAKDFKGVAGAYMNLGATYHYMGWHKEALKYYLLAEKTSKESNFMPGLAVVSGNIGNTYAMLKDYETAANYFKSSIKLNTEIQNYVSVALSNNALGKIALEKKDFKPAETYIARADSFLKAVGNLEAIIGNEINYGELKHLTHDIKSSVAHYTRAIKLADSLDVKNMIVDAYCGMSVIAEEQKNIPEAISLLTRALSIAKQSESLSQIKEAYGRLSELYAQNKQYKEAFEAGRNFTLFSDSLNKSASENELIRSTMRYEFDKETEQAKLEQVKKDAETEQRLFRQRITLAALAIIAILVLVFLLFLYNRFRLISKQKVIIEEQNTALGEKNSEILDSITYAKRLQDAILPPQHFIDKYLPENFVLYKPKDIVAGDFYWMEVKGDCVFIAAADSTGHGVPGAMVSVVCSNALNRAVNEFKQANTAFILDKTRELILDTFSKSSTNVNDGMDISLLCINRKKNTVQWSGANNALWYIQNNELMSITADKQPVGKTLYPKPFTLHEMHIVTGTQFYLFTDGYADQFGGEKGKKYKYKQLQNLLTSLSLLDMKSQKEKLENDFEAWKGHLEQVDDVCIIGIKL